MSNELLTKIAKESTSQEILQAVENIEVQVEGTSGLIVGTDGKKYKAVMSGEFMAPNTDDIAEKFKKQFLELFPDSNGPSLGQYFWQSVKDDIYVGYGKQNSEYIIFYDFLNEIIVAAYHPNTMSDIVNLSAPANSTFLCDGIGYNGFLNWCMDDKYIYIAGSKGSTLDWKSCVNLIMVFDIDTLGYRKILLVNGTGNVQVDVANFAHGLGAGCGFKVIGNVALHCKGTSSTALAIYKLTRDTEGEPQSINYHAQYTISTINASYSWCKSIMPLDSERVLLALGNSSTTKMAIISVNQLGTLSLLAFYPNINAGTWSLPGYDIYHHWKIDDVDYVYYVSATNVIIILKIEGSLIELKGSISNSAVSNTFTFDRHSNELLINSGMSVGGVFSYGDVLLSNAVCYYIENDTLKSRLLPCQGILPYQLIAVAGTSSSSPVGQYFMSIETLRTIILSDGKILSRRQLPSITTKYQLKRTIVNYEEVGDSQ